MAVNQAARISWTKANVTMNGAPTLERHRFRFDPAEGRATVHDRRGELVATIIASEVRSEGRLHVVVIGEGQEWLVQSQGCGCRG